MSTKSYVTCKIESHLLTAKHRKSSRYFSPSCRVLRSCLPTSSSHSDQFRQIRLVPTSGPDEPVFGPILDAISIQHHGMIDVGSRLVAGIENTYNIRSTPNDVDPKLYSHDARLSCGIHAVSCRSGTKRARTAPGCILYPARCRSPSDHKAVLGGESGINKSFTSFGPKC